MDWRAGVRVLIDVVGWTLGRTWLAILLAAVTVIAFGAYGTRHPRPEYGPGLAILDEQMRRSHDRPYADILLVGDSSGLHGVDPLALEQDLAGPRVDSLSAIGPARPPGYAELLANHLEHTEAPRVVVLVLHPMGLMHGLERHKRSEMNAILSGAWPAQSFAEEAAKGLNFHLFRGVLEEPFGGHHGRRYGNGRAMRRALRAGRGAFPHSAPGGGVGHESASADIEYEIHPQSRRHLAEMRTRLGDLEALGVYVALAPGPASIEGAASRASRERVLAAVLEILGLPPERALRIVATLPTAEFADFTHPSDAGRARLTRSLAQALSATGAL